MSDTIPAAELEELQAAATDRPDAQEAFGIQARNLAALHAAGVRIAFGTDGNTSWRRPCGDDRHGRRLECLPHDVIVAATRNSAALLGTQ